MSNDQTKDKNGTDKIIRYGWGDIKDAPPELQYIDKRRINIDHTYQRDLNLNRATTIAREWSWKAAGVILVAQRPDGSLWAFEGQHRLSAAMRRSDIEQVPCAVFKVENLIEEAKGFRDGNTLRKPITSLQQFRAKVIIGDKAALLVDRVLNDLGITIVSNGKVRPGKVCISCVTALLKTAAAAPEQFPYIMRLLFELAQKDGALIAEALVLGTFLLDRSVPGGVLSAKFKARMLQVGLDKIEKGIYQARAYRAYGSASVYAEGILNALNAGLRHKFEMSGGAA